MGKRVAGLPTVADTEVTVREFPLQKSDISYDPQRQEVTLPREKFDALIQYVGKLATHVDRAEDETAIARYELRRTSAAEKVWKECLLALRRWLEAPAHSINRLAQLAGIPYATCHRLVAGRIAEQKVSLGDLTKILRVIEEDAEPGLFAAMPEGDYSCVLVQSATARPAPEALRFFRKAGVEVVNVGRASQIHKTTELSEADLIIADVNVSNQVVDELQKLAKSQGTMVVMGQSSSKTFVRLVQNLCEDLKLSLPEGKE